MIGQIDGIEEDLRRLASRKTGNQELALFFDPEDNEWSLWLGNPCDYSSLGEVKGEVEGYGAKIDDAIKMALVGLQNYEWARTGNLDDKMGCENCGQVEIDVCVNGKHRCGRCNWSPELGDYAPIVES